MDLDPQEERLISIKALCCLCGDPRGVWYFRPSFHPCARYLHHDEEVVRLASDDLKCKDPDLYLQCEWTLSIVLNLQTDIDLNLQIEKFESRTLTYIIPFN